MKGVSKQDILIFFEKPRTDTEPTRFWFKQFGIDTFRSWFINFAAHHSADMDYVSREDFNISKTFYLNDFRASSESYRYKPLVWENSSQGWLYGQQIEGWGYDVWRLPTPGDKIYK